MSKSIQMRAMRDGLIPKMTTIECIDTSGEN